MQDLQVAGDDPPQPTPATRLMSYGAAWLESARIAEAYRVRVRRAVLEEIDDGMSVTAAARLAGVSRVTVNQWQRARRRDLARDAVRMIAALNVESS